MKLQFIAHLFMLISHSAYTQGYEGSPCGIGGNFSKELLQKKELKNTNFFISECNPDSGQLYTSMLKPSGKAPAKGIAGDPDGDYGYDVWTCTYSGYSAVDGNSTTAWVEGVAGDGKGELLMITKLDLSKKLEIHSGFGKNQALFAANNRPKTINLHIVRALPQGGGQSQCGSNYHSLKIINSSKVILKDVNQFQPLPMVPFKKETYLFQGEQWDYEYWLMIELVDVYPGTKYQDTCISEVRNVR